MYSCEDLKQAKRVFGYRLGVLLALLTPLTAVYICEIVKGRETMMLAVLLAGFACVVFAGDIWLLSAWRYMRFLREMDRGLRRSVVCVIEHIESKPQMQDGVRVYALQVRLQDGESRIFYLNISKMKQFADAGVRVKLTSYGRHVVDFELIEDV